MTDFRPRRLRSALAASAALGALLGSPALADVTSQQVWENWQQMLDLYGEGNVTVGAESQSGGALTVSDLTIRVEDGTDTVSATIGQIVFSENGDGTVSVTMSEANPLDITMEGVSVPLTIRNTNLSMLVSGTVEQMNYAITADRYGIEATPGTYGEARINAGTLFLEGLTGSYVSTTGDLREIDYAMTATAITLDVNISEPGGPGQVVMSGRIDGLQTEADLTVPADIATMENPDAVFVEGMSVEASYTFGASQYGMNVNADGDVGQGTASAAGGSMELAMSKDGFRYSGGAQQPRVSMFGFEIPFPVELAMDSYSYSVEVPLSKSDAPRDFGLAVALRGLTVNDVLWSIADPGQVLPRDPATVAIDISGKVRPLFDLLDPEQQMAAAQAQLPAEIDSLQLSGLEIRAVGAEVTGDGAFTFDNTDLATFDGFPRPEGSLKLSINGANGLIDKLISMGLLPQEQAMGARMMMGLFATPVGDDMLESVLEINAQGHVLANGQRLQ